ncbi:hypothetical protein GGR52DRAFT_384981 [Hypoxylon sp. FL1284]|nr:hypothetical protein GGR52DRAFT_384981 [Hypoxylon sp. FL1284]
MAAAVDVQLCAIATRCAVDRQEAPPSTATDSATVTRWDELDLSTRLGLIARAWVSAAPSLLLNHDNDAKFRSHTIVKPLVLPDPTPKRSRRLSKPPNELPTLPEAPVDPARAGEFARQRNLSRPGNGFAPPPPDDSLRRREQRRDSLIGDPTANIYLDLSSEHGFTQHAKKKAKKGPAQAFNWSETIQKETGGGGDGGDDGGNDQNGDAGKAGGGSGGDDKDKDKKDEKKDEEADPKPDDSLGVFETAGKKKKKAKNQVEEKTEPLETSTKPDSFQEIKLDDPGPSLDVNFGSTPDTKSNFLVKVEKKEEIDSNPWDINRPKPKKKGTGFSFGSPSQADDVQAEEPATSLGKADDKKGNDWDFGFTTSSAKKDKKGSVWDFEPEAEKKEDPPAEDNWGGWGTTTTKKKTKKGTAALAPEPEPPKVEPVEDFLVPSSKKDKKKKKSAVEETKEPEPVPPPPEPEPEPEPDPFRNLHKNRNQSRNR